jgi:hypothetical protein
MIFFNAWHLICRIYINISQTSTLQIFDKKFIAQAGTSEAFGSDKS